MVKIVEKKLPLGEIPPETKDFTKNSAHALPDQKCKQSKKHEGPLADILFIQNGSMHCQPLRQNTGETSQLCLLAAP